MSGHTKTPRLRTMIASAAWGWANRSFSEWGGVDGQDLELENALAVVFARVRELDWKPSPANAHEKLVAMLVKMQWSWQIGDGGLCPRCAGEFGTGHRDDCELAALLLEVKA